MNITRAELKAAIDEAHKRGIKVTGHLCSVTYPEAVELGIMDGLPGLEQIFKRFFSRAQTQRCQKHAKANACRRVRKKERELFSKAL